MRSPRLVNKFGYWPGHVDRIRAGIIFLVFWRSGGDPIWVASVRHTQLKMLEDEISDRSSSPATGNRKFLFVFRFSSCHPTKNKKNFVLFGSFRFVPSRSAFVFLCPLFFPLLLITKGATIPHDTLHTQRCSQPSCVCVCVLFRRVFYTHTHPHPFRVSSAREKFKLQLASLRRWGVSSIQQQQQLPTRYSTIFILCGVYVCACPTLVFCFLLGTSRGFHLMRLDRRQSGGASHIFIFIFSNFGAENLNFDRRRF